MKFTSFALLIVIVILFTALLKMKNRYENCDSDKFISFHAQETVRDLEFISGNYLAEIADFRIVMELKTRRMISDLNTEKLVNGSVIFVKSDYLGEFATAAHGIKTSFVLITHNGAISVPGSHAELLGNPFLIKWFAQNPELHHPLLRPIPVGIDNALRRKMNPQIDKNGNLILADEFVDIPPFSRRKTLILAKFSLRTNRKARNQAMSILEGNFPRNDTRVDYSGTSNHQQYLRRLRDVKFVASPPGRGIDCHRTWEALIMGCVPIVLNTSIVDVYKGGPVMVVNSWEEVTEQSLKKFEEDLNLAENDVLQTEIVRALHWKNLILKSRDLSL